MDQEAHSFSFAVFSGTHFNPSLFSSPYAHIRTDSPRVLRSLSERLIQASDVGLLIHLGNVIHSDPEFPNQIEDKKNFRYAMSALLASAKPTYVLAGPHEQKTLSRKDLQSVMESPVGTHSFDLSGCHFVFLEAQQGPDKRIFVSLSDIEWLDHDLSQTHLPAFLFCHHPLINHRYHDSLGQTRDVSSNTVENRSDVVAILEGAGNVAAVFSSSPLGTSVTSENGICHFGVENVLGLSHQDGQRNSSYGLVSISSNELTFTVVDAREPFEHIISLDQRAPTVSSLSDVVPVWGTKRFS